VLCCAVWCNALLCAGVLPCMPTVHARATFTVFLCVLAVQVFLCECLLQGQQLASDKIIPIFPKKHK
jgi:hypothetical protein